MCGRFVLAQDIPELMVRYTITHTSTSVSENEEPSILSHHASPPRYNIAPSMHVFTVASDRNGSRYLGRVHWGIRLPWRKEKLLINIRLETALTTPYFQNLLSTRRVIVPMQAFYEWKKGTRPPQPFLIRLKDTAHMDIFSVGALWHKSEEGQTQLALLTKPAEKNLEHLHARMPLILHRDQEERWLNRSNTDIDDFHTFLKGETPDLIYYPVSTRVNQSTIDDPHLIEPLEREQDENIEHDDHA